tara:strand:- start:7051 stop:7563 length:513 start_codon:yes stop_codon:yes gene_type:complete
MKKINKSLLFFSFLCLFVACNQLDIQSDDRTLAERKADIRESEGDYGIDGSILTLSDLLGTSNSLGFEGSVTYQAALQKVSFMPLNSVDSATGIIITDWYNINNDDLRIKINIRVFNEEISNDSLDVQIFKQIFDGQKWVDQGSDMDQASKIKKSILDEAKVIQATIDLS